MSLKSSSSFCIRHYFYLREENEELQVLDCFGDVVEVSGSESAKRMMALVDFSETQREYAHQLAPLKKIENTKCAARAVVFSLAIVIVF